MQLTIFNGSPRGKRSNTAVMLRQFKKGFLQNDRNEIRIECLVKTREIEQYVELFKNSDHVLIAFPLYTDAMPGIVKLFIEALAPLCKSDNMPSIGFMVHSGFSEACHSRYVERYLEKLADRLGCTYSGTIVKPGSEGVRLMSNSINRKLFKILNQMGQIYGERGIFDPILLKKMAPREKRSFLAVYAFRLFSKLGFTNLYWDMQLKKNAVFEKRFDRPYA